MIRGPRLWLPLVVLIAAAAVVGAWLGANSRSGPGQPGDTAGSGAPSSGAPSSLGPPASLPPGATPLVRIDPTLLTVLPKDVDGLSVLESSEGDADASSNASLAMLADAAVGGLAIDPASGDFVLALVVRLRPGVMDDAGFRSWRDAYDGGVCGGTGVSGNAETTIAGRQVFVGTCGNGLHTYHTWIAAKNLLVSASSGGTRNLGVTLFENLQP